MSSAAYRRDSVCKNEMMARGDILFFCLCFVERMIPIFKVDSIDMLRCVLDFFSPESLGI